MKILFVTQTFSPYFEKGGSVASISALADHLAARGHDVTVLTADLGPRREHTERPGVRAVYLPSAIRYRTATVNPSVFTAARREVPSRDIVHVFGMYDLVGPVVASECRRRGVPYVLEPLGMLRPQVRSLWKKRLYNVLVGRRMASGAKKVIATSSLEEAEVLAAGIPAERVQVRRNGVDLELFASLPARGAFRASLGIPSGALLVLFIGRISFIKGLDLLVSAFAGIPTLAHLVLVGPDDDDGSMAFVRGYVGPRIHVSPPLYGAAKVQALADSDVFVLPSRFESFGNVAIEAAACGVLVVVTKNCGVAPLLADEAAVVVDPDVGALRDGIERLLGDENLRRSLAARAREIAQSLTWDLPVAQMERLYTELRHSAGRNDLTFIEEGE